MPSLPLILIAPSTETKGSSFYDYFVALSDAYLECILMAGGMPMMMPIISNPQLVAEYVGRTDGVLLTGGDDIQPELYCENLSPTLRQTVSAVDKKRDLLETLLIREALDQKKPILAICRGHQILNVAMGGTLIVDIASQVATDLNHSVSVNKDKVVHSVKLEPGSLLNRIFGKEVIEVNSSHHQAVDKIAKPLRATGYSKDGIIEVMELKPEERHQSPYLLAVQFHPERLVRGNQEFLELFRSFTAACVENRKEKL
ncbi:MAG: gamma-glutamyl-gamma-aminobutyrate hydrolase family protein [Verrucomicrobiales bacterium]